VKASTFELVASDKWGAVRLAPRALKAVSELRKSSDENDVQRNVQLRRYFERFCELGPDGLDSAQFRREGAFKDGRGKKVAIFAFKPRQFRVYGAMLNVAGRRCFVGTHVDPSKKQNKADRALLEASAREIARLDEY
jgi:hypothetical protein